MKKDKHRPNGSNGSYDFFLVCANIDHKGAAHCGSHDFNRTSCEALGCCFLKDDNDDNFCFPPPSMFITFSFFYVGPIFLSVA